MNWSKLAAELAGDPLGRGYAGMSDAQAAASLNTEDRTRNRETLTGDALFGATDATEFGGLSDAKRALWVSFTSKDQIDPFGSANVAFVQWVFGAGADTVTALAALRTETVSRAVEIGLGTVKEGHVALARG